jgi:hypothetical protein
MTEEAQSGRARERAAQRARRMAKLAFSQSSFDLLASGYGPEQIAEARKVSVRTIQREIDGAIARRRLDAPDRYVHLQVARLTKALRMADAALEDGDLKAVRALVGLVSALDRYHGFAPSMAPPPPPPVAPALPAPPVAPALPPPPLELTHMAPPAAWLPSDGAAAGESPHDATDAAEIKQVSAPDGSEFRPA